MGTRNLTAVVLNGEYKVAQYGQWDGYPSGQGTTALEFLRSKKRRAALKKSLSKVMWLDEKEHQAALDEVGASDGWLTMEQSAAFHKLLPYTNRDHGAKILELLVEAEAPVKLTNSITFANDSLFCEWAYVIDFDKNTFEVYSGFNKKPLAEGERFASFVANTTTGDRDARGGVNPEYYPVRLVKSYSLDELPTTKEFVEEIENLTRD